MAIRIRCRHNGPYVIEAECEVYTASGERVDTGEKPKVALCRCGASATKPLCDGSHKRVGFCPDGPEPTAGES